ncbi:MAG: ATP-binding protein [bacterium]|nr:ATP-binding protein [bacterium]
MNKSTGSIRRFHSYGPVDCEEHFCVNRNALIESCRDQLTGKPDKHGSYFTIWAPRQAGKTWLMRQVKKTIRDRYDDRFLVVDVSMQGVVMEEDDPAEAFLKKIPKIMLDGFDIDVKAPSAWEDWSLFFHKRKGLFDRPVILFIDEFDSLPPAVIDRMVTLFRDMYLNRERYLLHGLALIGVRAVLGIESERGSPFNIQRALHIPNLTRDEVEELFKQYRDESGQQVEPEVVEKVFTATRGQPGLTCWFGELLTEKYNPGTGRTISGPDWKTVYNAALSREWNNNVLNMLKKAREKHRVYILDLFAKSNIPFNLYTEWTNYLYLNGIIDHEVMVDPEGEKKEVCRFSSPFVQAFLYRAMTGDLVKDRPPLLELEPMDDLADVFKGPLPDIPALLKRYKNYLGRLKAKGLNPWKDQPRRADLNLTEAAGHFHLYAWLQNIVGNRCVISPQFPTGNGKVDLHLRCGESSVIIEVKSFTTILHVKDAKSQAAGYARQMGLEQVTIAMFVPVEDETVIRELSTRETIEGIDITLVAIGWN